MKHLNQFYNHLLLESVILASDEVSEILSKCIKTKVGLELWLIIGDKKDVTTDFNTLGLSDKNDELFFLPDAKTQKLVDAGETPFGKNKQAMKIGRIARAILSKNGITVSDKDIEEFVNEYKAQFDIQKNKESNVEVIKLVEGEDIRFWYNEDNYQDDGLYGTELGQSCMRYNRCQEYLDIYVENPGQCKLLIYLNTDNQLKARALVWKLHYPDEHYFMDRPYTINSSDALVMAQWLCENLPGDEPIIFYSKRPTHDRVAQRSISGAEVILSKSEFDYYPYMDTFMYLSTNDDRISTQEDEGDYELQSTDGYRTETGIYCEYEGDNYPESEVVYSDYHNVSMRESNATYSDYHDTYIWSDDAVRSEKLDDYIHKDVAVYSEHLNDYLVGDDSVKVYLDADDDTSDYYPEDDKDIFAEDGYSGNNYLLDLLIEQDEVFILKKYAIKVYSSSDNKPEMLLDPVISELDAKLFRVKVNISSEKIMDKREYYDFKIKNHGPYDAWIELVNNTKASKTLKNRKISELVEAHQALMLDTDYKFEYLISKEGGVEEILSKWKNKIADFAKTIKRKDITDAAKEALSYRTALFGNYYYTEKKDFIEADEDTKKRLNELVTIMFKCLPSYLGAYKRKGFLHSYTSGSLGDRDILYSILKPTLQDNLPEVSKDELSRQGSKIVNTFRAVYSQLLSPVFEDGGNDLAKLLQYAHSKGELKI
jgi:hypothetical protein